MPVSGGPAPNESRRIVSRSPGGSTSEIKTTISSGQVHGNCSNDSRYCCHLVQQRAACDGRRALDEVVRHVEVGEAAEARRDVEGEYLVVVQRKPCEGRQAFEPLHLRDEARLQGHFLVENEETEGDREGERQREKRQDKVEELLPWYYLGQ